jgi:hypothetical protein
MKTFSDKRISSHHTINNTSQERDDVLDMTAGLGHSHRRAFSLKRNFVTHVDNGTLISEMYYGKKFSLKRRVCLGLYIHPVTWLRASRLRNRGSILGMGKRIFISFKLSRPVLGPTDPPVRWVSLAPSPGVKRLRQEADHSLLLVLNSMSE